jgi:hypothetical protein
MTALQQHNERRIPLAVMDPHSSVTILLAEKRDVERERERDYSVWLALDYFFLSLAIVNRLATPTRARIFLSLLGRRVVRVVCYHWRRLKNRAMKKCSLARLPAHFMSNDSEREEEASSFLEIYYIRNTCFPRDAYAAAVFL